MFLSYKRSNVHVSIIAICFCYFVSGLFHGISAAGTSASIASTNNGQCTLSRADPEFVNSMLLNERLHGVRRALVVGNAAYTPGIGLLHSPAKDAAAMTSALTRLGFDVFTTVNATHTQISECLQNLLSQTGDISIGAIFFSGHGLALDSKNLLLGTDAAADELLGVAAEELIEQIGTRAKTTLAFLDACRTNMVATVRQGLAPMRGQPTAAEAQANSRAKGVYVNDIAVLKVREVLIAYAAAPGSVANDGADDDLSPFSKALVSTIGKPGWEVSRVLAEVTQQTGNKTGGRQTPWSNKALSQSVFLNGVLDVEAAVQLSNAKARQALEQLRNGETDKAMSSALSAFPPKLDESNAPHFLEANDAVEIISRSKSVQLPIGRPRTPYSTFSRFSPDGKTVIIGELQPSTSSPEVHDAQPSVRLQLWDTEQKTVRAYIEKRRLAWDDFAFSLSGTFIFENLGYIHIRDEKTGKEISKLKDYADQVGTYVKNDSNKNPDQSYAYVRSSHIAPNGERAALIPLSTYGMPQMTADACVYIWDLKASGNGRIVCAPDTPLGSSLDIRFHPHKPLLLMKVTRESEAKAFLYNLSNGTFIATHTLPPAENAYELGKFMFSADGERILIQGQGRAFIFDNTLKLIDTVETSSDMTTAGFTPNGNIYFSDYFRARLAHTASEPAALRSTVVPNVVFNEYGERVAADEELIVIEHIWVYRLREHVTAVNNLRAKVRHEPIPVWIPEKIVSTAN